MPETVDAAPRRWRKRLLIGGALLVLLVVVGTIALLRTYPPERVAALVAEQVRARTGRDFAIRGQLSYRLLPRIAVVAEGLALGNAPWGSRKDMLRVERAALELELWPLLQGPDPGWQRRARRRRSAARDRPPWRGQLGSLGDAAGARRSVVPGSHRQHGIPGLRARHAALAPGGGRLPRAAESEQQLALESLDLDRTDNGNHVDAEWVVQRQRWRASGQLASLAALHRKRGRVALRSRAHERRRAHHREGTRAAGRGGAQRPPGARRDHRQGGRARALDVRPVGRAVADSRQSRLSRYRHSRCGPIRCS